MRRKGEKNFLCIYVYVIFPKVGKMLKDKKKKSKEKIKQFTVQRYGYTEKER